LISKWFRGNKYRAYRASALDRSWGSSRIVAVVGPLTGLEKAEIESTVKAIETATATPRIAISPLIADQRWAYQRGLAEGGVHVISDSSTANLGEFLTAIGNRAGDRRPTEVFLGGGYLAVEYPHAVGDGQYGVSLLAALAGSEPELPTDLPGNAVWQALWRLYSTHPKRLLAVRNLRNDQRSKVIDLQPSRTFVDWRQSRRVFVGRLDASRVRQLQEWVSKHAPGSGRVAVMSALWCAALRSAQVAVDERVVVLFDCRRYLPDSQRAALGNFAIGVPLKIGTLPPHQITALVRTVIETGWPVAAIGMAAVRSRLRGAIPADSTNAVAVPNQIRLAISNMGRAPASFDHLPWADGTPHQATAFVDLGGPDAMTLFLSDVGDGRNVAVTYCADMVSREIVEAAVERICSDPVTVLDTEFGASKY